MYNEKRVVCPNQLVFIELGSGGLRGRAQGDHGTGKDLNQKVSLSYFKPSTSTELSPPSSLHSSPGTLATGEEPCPPASGLMHLRGQPSDRKPPERRAARGTYKLPGGLQIPIPKAPFPTAHSGEEEPPPKQPTVGRGRQGGTRVHFGARL